MTYKKELIRSMKYLASKKNTIFIGQSVNYSGNAIFSTLEDVPKKKKLELPVFEDVQMGMSIGLSLEGFTTISCFPRFDFLICSMNQMVNHLDKFQKMTNKQLRPKVIIRTSIGSKIPLDGGVQHTQNYTKQLKSIFTEIELVELKKTSQIFNWFKRAYKSDHSFLFVEHGCYYDK